MWLYHNSINCIYKLYHYHNYCFITVVKSEQKLNFEKARRFESFLIIVNSIHWKRTFLLLVEENVNIFTAICKNYLTRIKFMYKSETRIEIFQQIPQHCASYRLILPEHCGVTVILHSAQSRRFLSINPRYPLLWFSRASIRAHGHPYSWSLSSKSIDRTERHVAEGCGSTRRALVRLNNRAHLCYWPYICGLDALCPEYSVPRSNFADDREPSFPENIMHRVTHRWTYSQARIAEDFCENCRISCLTEGSITRCRERETDDLQWLICPPSISHGW